MNAKQGKDENIPVAGVFKFVSKEQMQNLSQQVGVAILMFIEIYL